MINFCLFKIEKKLKNIKIIFFLLTRKVNSKEKILKYFHIIKLKNIQNQ